MFVYSGFQNFGYDPDRDAVYQMWPQKNSTDQTRRPPRHEQLCWLKGLRNAFAEMEADRAGVSLASIEKVAFEKQYVQRPLRIKKGREHEHGGRGLEEAYTRFQGSIEAAVYGKKKGTSAIPGRSHYDERLLELLVETYGKYTFAILRYRNDEKAEQIKGFIDLGCILRAGQVQSKTTVEGSVKFALKSNVAPTFVEGTAGKPPRKEKEGILKFVALSHGKGVKPREHAFKIPGTNAGVVFYNEVMIAMSTPKSKVIPLLSKRDMAPVQDQALLPATSGGAAAAAVLTAHAAGGGAAPESLLVANPKGKETRTKRGTGRFMAENIHLGTPRHSAAGLIDLLGYTTESIVQLIKDYGEGVSAIVKEIELHGNAEDQKNLRGLLDGTYENPPHKDGSLPSREELNGQSKTIDAIMDTVEAKGAKLKREHVLALRLYTTTSYKSVNMPLRNQSSSQHPLAVTTYFINEGLKKLRYYAGSLPDAYSPQTLWRGMKDVSLTQAFIHQGGCEFSCLSTSPLKEVAIEFAVGKTSLIFQIETIDFFDRGANVSFLSVYPEESEILYPPLMLLNAISKEVATEVVEWDGEMYRAQIIRVSLRKGCA